MVKITTESGKKTYLGHIYEYERVSFRMKDLDKIIKQASNWMRSKYGDRFVGFEFRPDFHNCYIARLENGFGDGTHLADSCQIASTGKQWSTSLYHEKIVGYHCGI